MTVCVCDCNVYVHRGPGHRETERSRLTRKDESDDEETPQNKRLRLAKEYLAELQAKGTCSSNLV